MHHHFVCTKVQRIQESSATHIRVLLNEGYDMNARGTKRKGKL